MIITCEKCHIKFQISKEEAMILRDAGRVLKCGNCHHMWLAEVSDDLSHIDAVTHEPHDIELIHKLRDDKSTAATLMSTVPAAPITKYDRVAHPPVTLKFILYGMIFLCIFALTIIKKDYLYDNAVILRPLLSMMGLNDNRGLEFEKITIDKDSFLANNPLTISGYIINQSDKILVMPDIRISFIDAQGEVIETIISDIAVKSLSPQEKTKIAHRIRTYPKNTDKIILDIGNYLEFFIR